MDWITAHWYQLGVLAGFLVVTYQLSRLFHALNVINENIRGIYAEINFYSREFRKMDIRWVLITMPYAIREFFRCIGSISEDTENLVEKLAPELHIKRRRRENQIEEVKNRAEERIANLRVSEEDGNLSSAHFYAEYLEKKQDYIGAYMWFQIIASRARNPDYAMACQQKVADKMTPEQITEAQHNAREWLDEHPSEEGKQARPRRWWRRERVV